MVEGKSFISTHKYFLIGLIYTLTYFVIFLILAIPGWEGRSTGCYSIGCFCETQQIDKMIYEPQNTWSNLAYAFSGLIILWKLDSLSQNKDLNSKNPFDHASFYSIMYALVVINICFGSFMYHANARYYGYYWDRAGMDMFVSFLLCYNLTRIFKKSEKFFLSLYIPLNTFFLLQMIYIILPVSLDVFTIVIAITGSFEMLFLIIQKYKGCFLGYNRKGKWFIIGFAIFNLSFLIHLLTNSGDLLCNPDGFQGHVLWHVGTAMATYFFYIYMGTEQKVVKNSTD
jgi:ceramidase